MSVNVGTRLGSLEITALLGKGGMGEVYRARDTKLKRDVAIKILPEEFSRDADRVSRFQREAEVLASLNHPNIAAIYDLQEANGSRFLILELIEGETLAERIARGPIPVEETLDITKYICEALEAAHEKGIIHRDLKPANVKLTPDGKVKVLDFGLAKAMEGTTTGTTTLSNSPTLLSGTVGGMIIGTAAYMSPEQAKGFSADARSDVFSFGCVLYEMLTGRQLFQGDTIAEVLGAVLVSSADLGLLPADLSPRIAELLRRCLEKNPKKRWQSVADLRADVEAIAAKPRREPIAAGAAAKPRPLWKRAIPIMVTAILFTIIGGVAVRNLNRPSSPPVARFPMLLPESQILHGSGRNLVAISPDGTRVAYFASGQIFLRSIAEVEARRIVTSSGNSLFFSPDSQWVGFWSGIDSTLKKIAVSGGAPVTLCKADTVFGVSWDGAQIVFGQSGKGVMRVSDNGGEPEVLIPIKLPEVADSPQILNGGEAVLFALSTEQGPDRWDKAQIVVQSLKSHERKVVFRGGSAVRYIPTGHLVYALKGTLLAVPFDIKALEVRGSPVPVVEGVLRETGTVTDSLTGAVTGAADYMSSARGDLIYIPGGAVAAVQKTLALVDRDGKIQPLGLPPQDYYDPRVSPDGKQLAVGTGLGSGDTVIWIYDIKSGGLPRRLTFGGRNFSPVWTPDGRRITFSSDREGDYGLFWQLADGSGTAERLLSKAEAIVLPRPEAWSPDGKILSFRVGTQLGDIWMLPRTGDQKPTPFLATPAYEGETAFSPNGQWLAYASSEIGNRMEIFVQPFPPTGAKYQISPDGGQAPLWSPDGKQLFYVRGSQSAPQLVAVDILTQPTFSFGKPDTIPIERSELPTVGFRNYDITPDGKHFVTVMLGSSSDDPAKRRTQQINVVLNWFEELKQRVPVR